MNGRVHCCFNICNTEGEESITGYSTRHRTFKSIRLFLKSFETMHTTVSNMYTIQIVVNVGSCYKLSYYILPTLLYFKSQRSTEGPLTVAFETIGRYLLKYFHPCAEMQRRKLCKCQDDLLKFLWKQFRKESYGSGEIHIPKK